MTLTTTTESPAARRRLSRRTVTIVAILAGLVAGWLIYFSQFGECSWDSKYCVVDIAGTRSELGAAWDGRVDLYVSTWPEGTTKSVTLF